MILPLALLLAPVALFNGTDLTGWTQEGGRPSFFVEKGEIRTSGRGHAGNWLRTEREYGDYLLRFEIKPAQWAEAGVLLRAARSERPQHTGLTLILAHDFHKQTTPWVTGAIAGVRAPLNPVPPGFGEWRRVEIELRGARLRALVDGIVAQDLDLDSVPELRHRLKRGFIGFPDMGHGYALRNLTVEDLGGAAGFVDLLGEGLQGWTRTGGGNWSLRGDTLEGSNGHGIIYAPGVWRDFVFSAVVRSHQRTNSGVFLRGKVPFKGGLERGFEVQVYSPVDAVYPTGSIYGLARSRLQADLEGRWFLMQVRVQGRRVEVWVDGQAVAEVDELPGGFPEEGRVGLQIHLEDTRVEWRDLRGWGLAGR